MRGCVVVVQHYTSNSESLENFWQAMVCVSGCCNGKSSFNVIKIQHDKSINTVEDIIKSGYKMKYDAHTEMGLLLRRREEFAFCARRAECDSAGAEGAARARPSKLISSTTFRTNSLKTRV
ncbi:hypothetical protein EVAR_79665_1 [Eumeta japonica]|uniref:Uncharacterized protein n=1 Tax=Eumeta variegata TaxID=151549 RepID=A0A4C1W8U8_EUMVA|nr:hypothetical protein EVAR_79665_1 [Eumeta japonica]